jgi:hypothetical protein
MIMTKQTKQPARITNVNSKAKNKIIPEVPLNEAMPSFNVEEAKVISATKLTKVTK